MSAIKALFSHLGVRMELWHPYKFFGRGNLLELLGILLDFWILPFLLYIALQNHIIWIPTLSHFCENVDSLF